MQFPGDQIQNMIYEVRGQRVMLDSDLAKLYMIETKVLIKQLKEMLDGFPMTLCFS